MNGYSSAAGAPGAEILTFGCRLNAFESEIIRGHTTALANTVVIHTCTVTAEAERTARAAIRRVARARPGADIVVTGCAAELDPAAWAALPGVTRVLGNAAKLRPESWGATGPAPPIKRIEGRARAYVQVQHGCDHRCTFCIIPFARGPSRSVPLGELVTQIRASVAAGYNEVVLTGVDIASYGPDLPGRPSLGETARRLLALVPGLPRLRLSSLDPAAIDDGLWRLLADEPRLMPHLHLSVQAGSDMVLKRMRRRHGRAEALAVIARARQLRPGIGIGADLIAGFPTETEALFHETLDFVNEAALPYLHCFPYSERPGTPAARMPSVPVPLRRARAAQLRSAAAAHAAAFHRAQLGHPVRVVVERGGTGHTEAFSPIRLTAPHRVGALITVRVTGADAAGLVA